MSYFFSLEDGHHYDHESFKQRTNSHETHSPVITEVLCYDSGYSGASVWRCLGAD